ncbi:MAG: hypothetical protein JNL11_20480 [Bdellovibrionaceae bacterium]|nr:hypothetical protein [Pseudobdellovibrionaceae bacterium]
MTWKNLILTVLIATLTFSCNKAKEDSTEEANSSETIITAALSEASAHAAASEGGAGFIAAQYTSQIDIMEDDQAQQASTGCRLSSRQCTSNTGTINWDGCSLVTPRLTTTMTGGWKETWTNVGDCTNGYLSTSDSVTRTTTGSTLNFSGGATITTDTNGGKSYDGTVFAAGGIITTRSNTNNRAVAMTPANSAIHKVFKGRRGSILYEYFMIPSLTITGAKVNGTNSGLGSSSANRAISGTMTVHHMLANYTATNTFSAVTWSDANCCYPTSGTISTTFSGAGAPSGSISLTFSTVCGTAAFTTPEGSSSLELTNCQ